MISAEYFLRFSEMLIIIIIIVMMAMIIIIMMMMMMMMIMTMTTTMVMVMVMKMMMLALLSIKFSSFPGCQRKSKNILNASCFKCQTRVCEAIFIHIVKSGNIYLIIVNQLPFASIVHLKPFCYATSAANSTIVPFIISPFIPYLQRKQY